MNAKTNALRDFLVVNNDGEIISSHLYRQDAVSDAKTIVSQAAGKRVRIYEGREAIFSRIVIDDDLPKDAPQARQS